MKLAWFILYEKSDTGQLSFKYYLKCLRCEFRKDILVGRGGKYRKIDEKSKLESISYYEREMLV